MIVDYIQAALHVAHYEIIGDPEPYYGEASELPGVYATGVPLRLVGTVYLKSSKVG